MAGNGFFPYAKIMKNNLFSTIILAAGGGTRMRASLPKVLHRIGGQTMIAHLLETLEKINCHSVCLVTAPSMEKVRQAVSGVDHAIQEQPFGTAHAVLAAEDFIAKSKKDILILYGDVPLITAETIEKVLAKGKAHDIVMLGMQVIGPHAYGRMVVEKDEVMEVIDAADCTPQQLKIDLCWAGILYIRHPVMLPFLKKIQNKNAQKEFYLTDIVKIARAAGCSVGVEKGALEELQGINTQAELARAEKIFQKRKRSELLEKGVTLIDPETVYVSYDTEIDKDVLIEPNVFMGLGVSVHAGAHIKAFSHLEGSVIHSGAVVGPFARLRPGTVVGEKCKIGNFVEIKKSVLGADTKVSHLTYLGDAELGKSVNIGAGTITCNYDGYHKHKTVIKDGVFVGSNTSLIAPVTLEKESMTGAGSVITQDVPAGDIAISRASQKNIRDASKRFHSKHSKK